MKEYSAFKFCFGALRETLFKKAASREVLVPGELRGIHYIHPPPLLRIVRTPDGPFREHPKLLDAARPARNISLPLPCCFEVV